MLIEDAEAFKNWLTVVLKPICEADPGALAKYVLALVKKDKSADVLRESMVSQLEVFLQGETEGFVKLLFNTLDSKDYLTPVIPNANPPNPNINTNAKQDGSPQRVKDVKKEIIPVSELANLTEPVNGALVLRKESELKRDREVRKSDSEREEKVRRRSGHGSPPRNRSRSRSWERNRRSRSRDKDREQYRDKRPRPYRNKSPPRRYARSRSRSPRPQYRGRYRNRSPPRSASRSRSRSLDKKDRKDVKNDGKDNHSNIGTPTHDTNHGDGLRISNSSQNIQSVGASQIKSGSHSPKKRCRDYDEQGFCMRGEMCPYDHGVDPVVLEDLSTALIEPTPILQPQIIPPPVHPIIHPHMQQRPIMPEYNPQAPLMWNRGGFRGPRAMLGPRLPPVVPFMPPTNLQRELIAVPVMDNQQPDHFVNNFPRPPYIPPDMDQDALFKKKSFDYSRLGPRAKNPSNCSLELKKVPAGLNNITHLNNHFAKFGKIVNIQVVYEGDPEAALVTFSSHAEANAAYRSTEAVLNNRFIKVFWHSIGGDGKQENVPPRSIKERLGTPHTVSPNTNKVLNLVQPKADNNDEEVSEKAQNNSFTKNNLVTSKEENKAQAAAAIVKGQELLAAKEKIKKNQEEKRKEALKLTQNLRKRKQELLEKQLAQQKILIEKLEKTSAGPQRELLLQTIKKSQESTESIRNDMLAQPLNASKSTPTRKTKEDVQKEVLDTELDLITKQQEGVDTSELQRKLFELKAKAKVQTRRLSHGRKFSPVSRHLLTKNNLIHGNKKNTKLVAGVKKTSQTHAVDHRPTKLLVSGYEADEQENLLAHFGAFGEIVDYVNDPATPSLILNYKSRKEAEVAILRGKNFQDRTLSITWCTTSQPSNPLSGRTSTRTVLVSESDDDHLIDNNFLDLEGGLELGPTLSEEALLHDDEEDDEDNEGRSWRR